MTLQYVGATQTIHELRELIKAIQGALGTEEDGDALIEVARNAQAARDRTA